MDHPPIFIFRFGEPGRYEYAVQWGDGAKGMTGGITSRLVAYNVARSWALSVPPDDVRPLIFFHADAVGQKDKHAPDYSKQD